MELELENEAYILDHFGTAMTDPLLHGFNLNSWISTYVNMYIYIYIYIYRSQPVDSDYVSEIG